MHLENMHEMIEKLTSCTKSAIENDQTHIGKYGIGEVVDMIKDLAEAEYYSKITKAMEEVKEEEEEEEKYMLRKMKDEYGEEDGQRYYNEYRYANGRYAPKGRGSRRGYTRMIPDTYAKYPAEYYRDMDMIDGRMYYTSADGSTGASSGKTGSNISSGMTSTRSYTDGYSDGDKHGYERGYSEGKRMSGGGRYDMARRGYEETKMHKTGNQQEDSQREMRELEKTLNAFESELTELLPKMSPAEKNLVKNKVVSWQNKV